MSSEMLRLSFEPQAVREHFEDAVTEDGEEPNPYDVSGYSDAELECAAEWALSEDMTWEYFGFIMERILEIAVNLRERDGTP